MGQSRIANQILDNSTMKLLVQIILLLTALPCMGQPTGHQKLFLKITDNEDTLRFEQLFNDQKIGRNTSLSYKKYQLSDISDNNTGFSYYPGNGCIHKPLMTENHRIQIIRNRMDTMKIELFNAFNVYFLYIPFQKGTFRMYVNDGTENQWYVNTLPYYPIPPYAPVYDITPIDWSAFKVKKDKNEQEYFISLQFEKQHLLAKPVLPEDDPNFKNSRRIQTLRVETADYNFDGQNDYREHKLNIKKQWNYFIYTDSTAGYVLDSFMSQLDITVFDSITKTFQVRKNKKISDASSQSDTYEFIQGKPVIVKKNLPALPPTHDLQKVKEATLQSIKTYTIHPFKFVLEKNTPSNIPAEKGCYANKILVYETSTNKLMYSLVAVGNKLRETENCADSLQIADYNFDGYPDFRICNYSLTGKHIYYIYHQQRNTFLIENTLTELNGLQFDFEKKIATGFTDRKEFPDYPSNTSYQYYMETLLFEGDKLENMTVTTTIYGDRSYISSIFKYINQKRIHPGDTIGIALQRKNVLIKNVEPFRFELEFNPEEKKTSGEKGAYVKVLNIYKGDRNVGHFEMYGNYLNEVPYWLDSIETADFNFDGYTDIRMYNSLLANGRYVYLLYNPEAEVQVFYQDTYFSLLMDAEFIPEKKIMKGRISEANQTIYFFLKNDTLTTTTQDIDLSKPPFIEESIYKNGRRTTLRTAYSRLEPELKKEYSDYNFDGVDDFRQQRKNSPYYWDVFIYNNKNEAYEKDTLLSKFEVLNYNKQEKTLNGYYQIRFDQTTWQTNYYQWSFTENKMVLYQIYTCQSTSPMSENHTCVISTLINGKWINKTQLGAE